MKSDISDIIYDWDTDEKMEDKFSKTEILLNNIGKEAAVDISCTFRAENESELQNYFLKSNILEEQESKSYLKISTNDITGKNANVHYRRDGAKKFYKNFRMGAYIRKLNSIPAHSNGEIRLPSYFIMMVNYNFMVNLKHEDTLPAVMPVLRLKVKFRDVYLKEWSVEYLLSMSSNYDFIDNSTLITSVECKQISKMKRVRSNWVKYVPLLAIVLLYAFLF